MQKNFVLAVILIVMISFCPIILSKVEADAVYEMQLEEVTWDHANITVLIIPADNESWWNSLYLKSTLDAIDEWNTAISNFTQKYSDYAYLSQLTMNAQVSNVSKNNFDVYISWIEQFENKSLDVGLTTSKPTELGTISNSNIILSTYDFKGDILDELDMHAVGLHELGHCLGLGHSNITGDAMYFTYSLNSRERAVSTLNMYGLSNVFGWMKHSTEFNPDNQDPVIHSVVLPSTIDYEYLAIPKTDIIPASISNLQIIIIIVASAAAVLMSVYTVVRRRSISRRG